MKQVLLKNLSSLPDDQLDALFAQIFALDPLPYSSGAHSSILLDLVLDHAIKLEADRTPTKGSKFVVLTLTPRANRLRFSELREIYFQGLDLKPEKDAVFRSGKSITRYGNNFNTTLMKCLLELAYRDAFEFW